MLAFLSSVKLGAVELLEEIGQGRILGWNVIGEVALARGSLPC